MISRRNSLAGILFGSWVMGGAAMADVMYVAPVTVAAKTGSIFSNPALMQRDLGVALSDAQVEIRLSAPSPEALSATVEASFTMERHPGDLGTPKFLAAFPLCHYRHPFLALNNFAVKVDGLAAPLVQRKTGTVGYSIWSQDVLCDSPIFGELPQSIRLPALAVREGQWKSAREPQPNKRPVWPQKVQLNDGSEWENCYLWLMTMQPGTRSKVTVSYSCKIPRQENVWRVENQSCYSGPSSPAAKMAHNIPEDFYHKVGAGSFYFFSYVLRSGATWRGPIGSERIRLIAERGIDLNRAILHAPANVRLGPQELVVEISQEDPASDLILAVPAPAPPKADRKVQKSN